MLYTQEILAGAANTEADDPCNPVSARCNVGYEGTAATVALAGITANHPAQSILLLSR